MSIPKKKPFSCIDKSSRDIVPRAGGKWLLLEDAGSTAPAPRFMSDLRPPPKDSRAFPGPVTASLPGVNFCIFLEGAVAARHTQIISDPTSMP